MLDAESKDSDALLLGGMIDCLLTTPEEFSERYLLAQAEKPTAMMLELTNSYLRFERNNPGQLSDNFIKAYESSGFKTSLTTIQERFNKEAKGYFDEQLAAMRYKKQLYTEDLMKKADGVVSSLLTNPYTSKYFKVGENEEMLNQLEIKFSIRDIDFVSILDMVRIYHDRKEIDLIDIKTTGFTVSSFDKSIEQFQYVLQLVMYGLALHHYFKENRPELLTYNLNFKWIVESTVYTGTPCIYKLKRQDWEKGLNKLYKLIDDLIWYQTNNSWTYKREVIENNGEIEANIVND